MKKDKEALKKINQICNLVSEIEFVDDDILDSCIDVLNGCIVDARKEDVPEEHLERPKGLLEKAQKYKKQRTLEKIKSKQKKLSNKLAKKLEKLSEVEAWEPEAKEKLETIVKDLNIEELEEIKNVADSSLWFYLDDEIFKRKYYFIKNKEYIKEKVTSIPQKEYETWQNYFDELAKLTAAKQREEIKKATLVHEMCFGTIEKNKKYRDERLMETLKFLKEIDIKREIEQKYDDYLIKTGMKKKEIKTLKDLDELFNED